MLNKARMPSSIVVHMGKAKEPSIASALLIVAAEEEARERQKAKLVNTDDTSTTAAVDAGASASTSSSFSISKREEQKCGKTDVDMKLSDSFETLPYKFKHDALRQDTANVPMKEEEEDDDANTADKDTIHQKPDILLRSAEGCKNKSIIGGECLVHGAMMSLLHSDDTIGVERAPSSKKSQDDYDETDSSDESKIAASFKYEEGDSAHKKTNIVKKRINDCLFGRGGGTNHNPGNKKYRKIVNSKKAEYVVSSRANKPIISRKIVSDWRAMNPPGRFLELDKSTGLYNDVGDERAKEKTSQALREKVTEQPKFKRRKREEKQGQYKVISAGDPLSLF